MAKQQTVRESKVIIPAYEMETIFFHDTQPNYVHFNNSGNQPLYIGRNANVSPQVYDTVAPAYSSRLFHQAQPFNRLNIYNSSDQPATVIVQSWEGDFDPSLMTQAMELVGTGVGGILGIVDIGNLLSPLPAGTNHVGRMTISNFGTALPTGSNKIGVVEVDQVALSGHSHKHQNTAQNETVVVKAGEGIVFKVSSDVDVELYDDTMQKWIATKEVDFSNGLLFSNNITIKMLEVGTCFIHYK